MKNIYTKLTCPAYRSVSGYSGFDDDGNLSTDCMYLTMLTPDIKDRPIMVIKHTIREGEPTRLGPAAIINRVEGKQPGEILP